MAEQAGAVVVCRRGWDVVLEVMRYGLVFIGGVFGVILFLVEVNSRHVIPLGAYLVPIAMILSAALWRTESGEGGNDYYSVHARVFGLLADGPMKMTALIDQLNGSNYSDRWNRIHLASVGRMLECMDLVVEDGLVRIASKGE